jgi:hypothetical protein
MWRSWGRNSSKGLVNIYILTWYHIPEGLNLQFWECWLNTEQGLLVYLYTEFKVICSLVPVMKIYSFVFLWQVSNVFFLSLLLLEVLLFLGSSKTKQTKENISFNFMEFLVLYFGSGWQKLYSTCMEIMIL